MVNAVTYSSVLKSFNHRKLFHRVWEVYDEMIQQKAEPTELYSRLRLHVRARLYLRVLGLVVPTRWDASTPYHGRWTEVIER